MSIAFDQEPHSLHAFAGSGDAAVAEETLSEVAREELERAGWNVERAAHGMAARVKDDEQLLLRLLSEYLESVKDGRRVAERSAIRAAYAHQSHDRSQRGDRVHALAAGNARMLMDWPLPDGTRLSDATREQVRKAAEGTYKQADTMRWDARWYALIAAKMPEGTTKHVRSLLDEATLFKLREKAKHAKR